MVFKAMDSSCGVLIFLLSRMNKSLEKIKRVNSHHLSTLLKLQYFLINTRILVKHRFFTCNGNRFESIHKTLGTINVMVFFSFS